MPQEDVIGKGWKGEREKGWKGTAEARKKIESGGGKPHSLAPGAWTTPRKGDGPISASAGVAEWKGDGPKTIWEIRTAGDRRFDSALRQSYRPCGGRENATGLEPVPSGDVPVRLGAGPIAMRRWSSGGTPVLQTGGRSFESGPAQMLL